MDNKVLKYKSIGGEFYVCAESLFYILEIKDKSLSEWVEEVVEDVFHKDDFTTSNNALILKLSYARDLAILANTENSAFIRTEIENLARRNPAEDAANMVELEVGKIKRASLSFITSLNSKSFNAKLTYEFVNILIARFYSNESYSVKDKLKMLGEIEDALNAYRKNKFPDTCPSALFDIYIIIRDNSEGLSNSSRGGLQDQLTILKKENADIKKENTELRRLIEEHGQSDSFDFNFDTLTELYNNDPQFKDFVNNFMKDKYKENLKGACANMSRAFVEYMVDAVDMDE